MENQGKKIVFMRPSPHNAAGGELCEGQGGAARASSGMGRVATFAAFLAILLAVFFFFALQQQVSSVIAELKTHSSGMKTQVSEMNKRVQGLEEKIPVIDAVPAMAHRTVLRSMLKDVEQRMVFLAKEAETEEQSAKLHQARELVSQVQADLKE